MPQWLMPSLLLAAVAAYAEPLPAPALVADGALHLAHQRLAREPRDRLGHHLLQLAAIFEHQQAAALQRQLQERGSLEAPALHLLDGGRSYARWLQQEAVPYYRQREAAINQRIARTLQTVAREIDPGKPRIDALPTLAEALAALARAKERLGQGGAAAAAMSEPAAALRALRGIELRFLPEQPARAAERLNRTLRPAGLHIRFVRHDFPQVRAVQSRATGGVTFTGLPGNPERREAGGVRDADAAEALDAMCAYYGWEWALRDDAVLITDPDATGADQPNGNTRPRRGDRPRFGPGFRLPRRR